MYDYLLLHVSKISSSKKKVPKKWVLWSAQAILFSVTLLTDYVWVFFHDQIFWPLTWPRKSAPDHPAGRCVWTSGYETLSEHCSINSNNPRRQDLIMCKANSTLNNVSLSIYPSISTTGAPGLRDDSCLIWTSFFDREKVPQIII